MLSYILICFSVVCMAVMFSAIFKRGFEQSAPLAVIFVILFVYAAGMVKLARFGVFAVIIISFICMLFAVFISIGHGEGMTLVKNIFSVGFAVFVIMAVLIFLMTRQAHLSQTDSAGYTLTLVRTILSDGNFKNVPLYSESMIGMQPGFAIFLYMFNAIKGTFSDTEVLRGSYIFMLAMMLPVFSKIRWKCGYLAIGAAALMAGILYISRENIPVLGSVNPDAATMLVFAMMLVTYMCCEQCGYVYWTLGFGNAMLCIIRPGGEILVILMFLIVILDIAGLGFWEVGELFAAVSKWVSVFFCILTTVAVYASWRIYSARYGISRLIDSIHMSPERSLGFAGRLDQVFRSFAGGRMLLPYLVWIAAIIVIGAGAALLADGFWNKIRTGIQTAVVLLGFVIFLFALAFAYTYIFPISTNIKGTVNVFISGYIVAALIYAVNIFISKITDRFFTA